jgi:hypothetical protein
MTPPEEMAIREALCSSPVLAAMRRWLANAEALPSYEEFLARFGRRYSSYRLRWADLGRSASGRDEIHRESMMVYERHAFIAEFGFALPCREAIDALGRLSPLVEIGAGAGAWARLMANAGIDVAATDAFLWPAGDDNPYAFEIGRWFPIEAVTALAAIERWPERNVFCSWPSLGEPWFQEAVAAIAGGLRLAVVFEEATATEEAWRFVEREFALETDFRCRPSAGATTASRFGGGDEHTAPRPADPRGAR